MTDLFNIAHGAGGLFEVHQWNGDLELNVQDRIVDDAPVRDRIIVTKIGGLHALGDHEDPRSPHRARIGETPYPTSQNGITRPYEGAIVAPTMPLLRALRTRMLAAFSDLSAEGYMDIIPQVGDTSPTARFYAKPLQLDIDDEITTDPNGLFSRAYLLGLRASDPRKYFPSLAVSETGTSSVAVTNAGDAPADPVITITGASGDVAISDGTRTLTFADVPSGTLIVDFASSPRTAKVSTTNVALDVPNSDWWDPFVQGIAAGATVTVAQTGGTGITVAFTPATWG